MAIQGSFGDGSERESSPGLHRVYLRIVLDRITLDCKWRSLLDRVSQFSSSHALDHR
jgi:hypothetical protein